MLIIIIIIILIRFKAIFWLFGSGLLFGATLYMNLTFIVCLLERLCLRYATDRNAAYNDVFRVQGKGMMTTYWLLDRDGKKSEQLSNSKT